MNKTELIDKLLHLGNTTEMCSSTDRHNAKEIAHTLIDEYLEAINYTRCCKQLFYSDSICFPVNTCSFFNSNSVSVKSPFSFNS